MMRRQSKSILLTGSKLQIYQNETKNGDLGFLLGLLDCVKTVFRACIIFWVFEICLSQGTMEKEKAASFFLFLFRPFTFRELTINWNVAHYLPVL